MTALPPYTFQVQARVLVEKRVWKNAGEWASKAERQWKQTTIEGRKTREEMDREEGPEIKKQEMKPFH